MTEALRLAVKLHGKNEPHGSGCHTAQYRFYPRPGKAGCEKEGIA